MILSEIASVALLAFSLALDTFAVSIGVGIRGVTREAKFRIGAAFATAEVTMNVIGAGVGTLVGRAIGDVAAYIGFGALIAVGVFMVIETVRETEEPLDFSHGYGLFVAALSMSLDSLGIGFSIVYIGVPLVVTLGAIAFASISSTALGLQLGQKFGKVVGDRAGVVAGFVLMITGGVFVVLRVLRIG